MMSNDLTDAVVDEGHLSGDVTSRVPGVRRVIGLKYDSRLRTEGIVQHAGTPRQVPRAMEVRKPSSST
jgi:hypothetical protein